MQLTTYLNFSGQCEAAFKYYEKCLDAKITFLLCWEESPMAGDAPAGWGKKILHATLDVGGVILNGADTPATEFAPQGFTLMLNLTDAAQADRVFRALAENGNVTMPLQETFWAVRFGSLIDQFGIPWSINCEKPA